MMIGFGAAAGIAARLHLTSAAVAPIIRQAMTPHKVVALTFDDGPSPRWTPKVLAVLHKDHVHATFFIIGSHALRHPALVRDEQRAGMDIESHGHQHLILRHRTAAEVRQEVEYNAHILKSLGVPHPTLYRLPGGAADPIALQVLGQMGYRVIGWSIDPRDWQHRYSAAQMVHRIATQIHPGAIIIFHDGPNGSQATVDTVAQIIPALKRDGYRFLTVPQLLQDEAQAQHRSPGTPHASVFP
ncbi:polysaccharide deacetylase family protein [Sulfobacillus thermosulfidooxidans]|uniref:polysaccharide deacetylase family protein n=1 Tax=Sulfobacillus thermosulfidooxidans TaxID=28034 RepID=UPI0006B598A5|nr:polysaccharide deacetylase family protein [Sulfobacillus thermosulfidooxidans]